MGMKRLLSEVMNCARATVFCDYLGYYWAARCVIFNQEYVGKGHHSGPRLAADEVLAQITADLGPHVTMHRISQKRYEISVSNKGGE